jgi:small basic protein
MKLEKNLFVQAIGKFLLGVVILGLLIFLAVPTVFWSVIPIAVVAGIATFAAIQEGHFIRTEKTNNQ